MNPKIDPIQPGQPIDGVRLGTTRAGIKAPNRPDLTVIELSPKTTSAAVFYKLLSLPYHEIRKTR